jgi:hypothetical protein
VTPHYLPSWAARTEELIRADALNQRLPTSEVFKINGPGAQQEADCTEFVWRLRRTTDLRWFQVPRVNRAARRSGRALRRRRGASYWFAGTRG